MAEIIPEEYFTSIRNIGTELPLLGKPCHDCAVECGFYQDYSDSLKLLSDDIRLEVSKKWFCHNNRRRACKGNAEIQGLSW